VRGGGEPAQSRSEAAEPGPKSGRLGPKRAQSGPKRAQSGPKKAPSGPKSGRQTEKPRAITPLDNHDAWREAQSNPVLGELAIATAVQQAQQALSQEQWASLPSEFQRLLEQHAAGTEPGSEGRSLGRGRLFRPIDWRAQLRDYVGRSIQHRPVFNRPPRRLPHLIGIVPAQIRETSKPVIMAVIDTSASMDEVLLAQISGELGRMARDYEVVVVECDAAIQACYRYRGPIESVRGRGGTDLRPPFDPGFLAKARVDMILYLTDARGPAPEKPPRVPTVWCLPPTGVRPASWGRVIRLGEPLNEPGRRAT